MQTARLPASITCFTWQVKVVISGLITWFTWFTCLHFCLDYLGGPYYVGVPLPGNPSVGFFFVLFCFVFCCARAHRGDKGAGNV